MQWDHYWEQCVGSGHALLGLRQDWREHLKIAHDSLGYTVVVVYCISFIKPIVLIISRFQFVRFHGLFDDDMSVYFGEADETYSFFNVDSIYDFLLSIKMKPLIELSFMPDALASGNQTIFHYKGNITPPKNYTQWYLLVQALAQHLVDR